MAVDTTNPFDQARLERLMGQAVVDMGAIFNGALVALGEELGLYEALGAGEALTPEELARRTGTAERYVHEWLNAQAASGYVTYDPARARYSLSLEQALVFAHPQSPAYVLGGFQSAIAAARIGPKLAEAFRSGAGVGWHEHDHALFHNTERFYAAGYRANLVQAWIPALAGVEAKLVAGAKVADIGCGHGASTILMAQAFPRSTFVGSDYHAESIATARERAAEAGVADRVRFEVADATAFSGAGYALVTTFDALHDMGEPVAVSARVREALAPDGAWMIVEPRVGDRVEENLNPLGRLFYAASTLMCTPNALSQSDGAALGAAAGEARIGAVVRRAGFTRFRRAVESPVNAVYEARP